MNKSKLFLILVLIFEILFIITSIIVCIMYFNLSFQESISINGSLCSIKGLIYAISFLIYGNRRSDVLEDKVSDIHNTFITNEYQI